MTKKTKFNVSNVANSTTTTGSASASTVSFTYPDAARIKAEIHVLQILHLILTAAVLTMLLL